MMCMCECCTGIIPEFREETLKPGINPRFPVYLALIPGCREETLKPGIIRYYGGREVQCRRRPTVGPTSLRRLADVAPTSGRRRSDVAPTSGRRRSDVALTSGRRRSDVALTSLRIAPLSLDRTPYMYNVYACVTCCCIYSR